MNHSPETQILPAVAAAIFNDKGEVLLQRRRDVNQWCIISGHVEFGETVEEAICARSWKKPIQKQGSFASLGFIRRLFRKLIIMQSVLCSTLPLILKCSWKKR